MQFSLISNLMVVFFVFTVFFATTPQNLFLETVVLGRTEGVLEQLSSKISIIFYVCGFLVSYLNIEFKKFFLRKCHCSFEIMAVIRVL